MQNFLRARGSEHTSNFCEQFEQRPNFASAFKLWDHSIPLTHTCTCREASTLEKLKTRQSLVSLDLCLKKSGLENPTTIVCSSFSKPQSAKQSNASIMWTAHQIWLLTKLVRSCWLDIDQVIFVACLWTKAELRSIHEQKKNEANIWRGVLTEQVWSIEDLLREIKSTSFSCGTQRVI